MTYLAIVPSRLNLLIRQARHLVARIASLLFSATFKMDQVVYRKFPFEEFYLPIVVTTDYPAYAIVFAADEHDSLVSDCVGSSGYRFVGLKSRNIFYRANTF